MIKNRRDAEFHQLFDDLPREIQLSARRTFRLFLANPFHGSLRRHDLKDEKKGRHEKGSWSVAVTMKYRAICVTLGDTNHWYWIGTHNDYESFIGRK